MSRYGRDRAMRMRNRRIGSYDRRMSDYRMGTVKDYRRDYDEDDYRPYSEYTDGKYRGSLEYMGDMEYGIEDGRRGVKGTGRYGIGGSRYYGDRARSGSDYHHEEMYDDDDYRRYGYDRASEGELHLSKKDMTEWKRNMVNADGSLGEHFDGQRVKEMAERLGIKYKGYDEKELCLVTNMLYSDFCEALKGVIPPEKELMTYVKLAKAWLEDEDAPEGSEKLALYYYDVICDEED